MNKFQATGTILDKICAAKAQELEQLQAQRPLAELKRELATMPAASSRQFLRKSDSVQIIAEIKQASPSAGILRQNFNPSEIASIYSSAGADALSVITEVDHFQGKLDFISTVRQVSELPILRKDFLFDAYHIYEAKLAGADAVLLIVAILSDRQLHELYALATDLGLAVLVEAHTEAEVERALAVNPAIVGINNRNLNSFVIDTDTFNRLAPLIPNSVIKVVESGIETQADLRTAAAHGADAALIGSSLMRATDIGAKLRELTSLQVSL